MGAACCVAAKDKTITSGTSPIETLSRHVRYSPSWSFRWDNRVRVAEEETSVNSRTSGGVGNERMEFKSNDTTADAVFGSERDSPLDSSRSCLWQKSPVSEVNAGIQSIPSCGQASPQNITEVKDSTGSSSISYPSPVKLSPSVPSVSSLSTSPISSQSHLLPQNSNIKFHHRSPANRLLRQASDTTIPENKSPTYSVSSDTWSIPGFSELINTRRERWSFDSEASGFSRDKITRSSGRNSRSLSFDLQPCGICSKLLTERSSLGLSSQKLISISNNGLAVVSVLTCGHVYHAECLEYMTPEINKYDPSCPVCTFGEKKLAKMSEKALKAKLESKARKKKSRKYFVVDSDRSGSDVSSDHYKSGGLEGKGSKLSLSSSMKSSFGKPFLSRHFSFGSKSSSTRPPSSDNHQSSIRKGFFWARSSKY